MSSSGNPFPSGEPPHTLLRVIRQLDPDVARRLARRMDRVCGEATATLSAAVMLLPWSPAAARARAGAGWWHREAVRMRTRASLIELPGASPVALHHLDTDLASLEYLREEVSICSRVQSFKSAT